MQPEVHEASTSVTARETYGFFLMVSTCQTSVQGGHVRVRGDILGSCPISGWITSHIRSLNEFAWLSHDVISGPTKTCGTTSNTLRLSVVGGFGV